MEAPPLHQDTEQPGLTMKEKVKEISLLSTLNIALPTVDIYSDLALLVKLFTNGHPKYASLLLAPFLLNYLICWILWRRLEKRKTVSWIPALLGCFPQYCAAKVIRTLWRTPAREGGQEELLTMDQWTIRQGPQLRTLMQEQQ